MIFSPLLPREKGPGDEVDTSFPTLLTDINNFCLYQVYNNDAQYLQIDHSYIKFDISGER